MKMGLSPISCNLLPPGGCWLFGLLLLPVARHAGFWLGETNVASPTSLAFRCLEATVAFQLFLR